MKKNVLKIVSILLIAILIAGVSSAVLAYTEDIGAFKGTTSEGGNKAQGIANVIIGFVQVVGMAAAVIMLIVLAIKYVSAAPGEKADIKKSAVVYVVGAVLLFAATGILQLVKGIASGINEDDGTGGRGMKQTIENRKLA